MQNAVDFWGYWYLHVPNYILAAVMYSLIARFILSFFFPADHPNYIVRAFKLVTGWFLRFVRFFTPAVVPDMILMLLGVVWLLALRFGLFVVFKSLDLAPAIGS